MARNKYDTDEVLEESFDVNQLKRLGKYVKPYMGRMICIIILMLSASALTMTIPLKNEYSVGDKILALISYDNIFIMLEPQTSSIRNIFKGKVTEMRLQDEMVRVKIDIGGVDIFSDITLSAGKDLDLGLGKEVYIGFKALSIATLKL